SRVTVSTLRRENSATIAVRARANFSFNSLISASFSLLSTLLSPPPVISRASGVRPSPVLPGPEAEARSDSEEHHPRGGGRPVPASPSDRSHCLGRAGVHISPFRRAGPQEASPSLLSRTRGCRSSSPLPGKGGLAPAEPARLPPAHRESQNPLPVAGVDDLGVELDARTHGGADGDSLEVNALGGCRFQLHHQLDEGVEVLGQLLRSKAGFAHRGMDDSGLLRPELDFAPLG